MSRIKVASSAPAIPDWQKPVIVAPLTQAFPQFQSVKEFRSKVCLFNHDRTQVFDVTSDRYQVVQHGEAVASVEKALASFFGKGAAPTFNVRSLNGGARIRAEVKLPIPDVKLAKGDVSHLTLIMRNSYDRSCSFSAKLGAFRLVCSNGMTVGETFGAIKAKHIVRVGHELGDGQDSILDQLGEVIKRAPMVKEIWEKWADQRVIPEEAAAAIDWLPAKYRTPLVEAPAWKRPVNAWEFYNMLTHMSTHLTGSLQRRMDFDEKISQMFYEAEDLAFTE